MVVVLLFAAISGVRSWIWPNNTPATVVGGQSGYPSDDARAVATRYAVSYLSWDETNPTARGRQIALDLADRMDTTAGWNLKGKQTADQAYPGEVKVDSSGVTAVVDVRVRIQSYTKKNNVWAAGPYSWVRLSVPVAKGASRVVVTGPPMYVPDNPDVLPDDIPEAGALDADLSKATQEDAKAFFTAYAGDNPSAVTAPGSTIRGLGGLVRFAQLKDWQVYTGNDDERRATAVVTWDGAGDTTLDQTYTLTLRRTVATDGAQRWQVAAVG